MSDEQVVAEVVVNEPEAILETAEAVDPTLLDSEEPEAEEAAQDTEETLDKKDPWYKKRIDELTRDKHEARRQSERLEKLLEQLVGGGLALAAQVSHDGTDVALDHPPA